MAETQTPKIGMVMSADYIQSKELLKLAPMIDAMGYSQVSVPEIWGHDAISLISILAHITRKVRLATGIVNIFSRTPAIMAMTAASIAEVSRGRFTLGLGLSGPKVIEGLHGMSFDKPLTRTREYVDILRTLLAGKRLNHETKTLGTVKNFKISIDEIKPVPIHIASLGPKNVQLTAEIADGWIPVVMPNEEFERQVNTVHQHLEKYGKKKEEFEITPFVLALAGDGKDTTDLLRGHLAYYFATMGTFYNNMLKRSGYEEEADKLMELGKRGKLKEAAATITDEILAKTCIFGDKDQMQEGIMRVIKAGATNPLISLPFKSTMDMGMKTFQALAPSGLSL